MARFIIWRILQLPLILVVIYLITFALVWVVPGSPYGNNDRAMSDVAKKDLKERFHAQSWESFLAYYPWQIISNGDFGPSLSYEGWSVNDILRSSLPVSITLGLFSILIALGVWMQRGGGGGGASSGWDSGFFELGGCAGGDQLAGVCCRGVDDRYFFGLAALVSEWGLGAISAYGFAGVCIGADADGVYRAADAGFDAGYFGE